jgi:hypothetical protein
MNPVDGLARQLNSRASAFTPTFVTLALLAGRPMR